MANMLLNPDLEMALKFLIAVIDNEVNTGTADEMVTIDAFNEKLEANGQWIMCAGLQKGKGHCHR